MMHLRDLWVARRGAATVEFALASLMMFGVVMVGLDFGVYAQQKLRLGSAVEQAAVLAYNTQVTSNTAGLVTLVQTAAKTSSKPTVAVTCNGTSTCGDGKCSCLTGSSGFTIAATCNTACANGSISGNYLKIVASLTYTSIVVPDKYLGGTTMTQSAVVRLQ